jgi:hypothetical protein
VRAPGDLRGVAVAGDEHRDAELDAGLEVLGSSRSGSVSLMVRLMAKGRSVRCLIHARASRKASCVRRLIEGIEPRMPASAAATIISLLEMMNIGAATSGYRRPSLTCKGVGLMGSQL